MGGRPQRTAHRTRWVLREPAPSLQWDRPQHAQPRSHCCDRPWDPGGRGISSVCQALPAPSAPRVTLTGPPGQPGGSTEERQDSRKRTANYTGLRGANSSQLRGPIFSSHSQKYIKHYRTLCTYKFSSHCWPCLIRVRCVNSTAWPRTAFPVTVIVLEKSMGCVCAD